MLYIRSLDLFTLHVCYFVFSDLHLPISSLHPENHCFIHHLCIWMRLCDDFSPVSGWFHYYNVLHSCYSKRQDLLFRGWVIFLYVHIYHRFYIHLSLDGHWACFHVLATVNMPQWTWECSCLYSGDIISFGAMPRRKMTTQRFLTCIPQLWSQRG